ncbi:MAG: LysR family transcriptional regulator [Lachnospiraceae bacterium]
MALLMSKKLKYFMVCFETQCINYAAEQLCITRTPLARVLHELEERTGGRLFERRYNKLEPTDLAQSLYEKVRPAYDLLSSIEVEFNMISGLSPLEMFCDISVPHIIYQHLVFNLKKLNPSLNCRRVFITPSDMKSIILNPNILIFSFRKIVLPETFRHYEISHESLYLLMPDSISESDFLDYETMKNIKLFIRKDSLTPELKGIISRSLRNHMPYLEIKETEQDTASILMAVSAGEGMMLLPECLTSYFSPPNTHQIQLSDINVRTSLYVNRRLKNEKIVNDVLEMLDSVTHKKTSKTDLKYPESGSDCEFN